MRRRLTRPALAVVLAVVAGACALGASADPVVSTSVPGPGGSTSTTGAAPELRIAFVQDLSLPGADALALPALHGAELAVSNAELVGDLETGVALVPLDTGGDPATAEEVAAQIAGDPTYVAAVLAPSLLDQAAVAVPLDRAGVPTLSLSSAQSGLAGLGLADRRRLVATSAREASALAAAVDALPGSRTGVCLLEGASAPDARWASAIVRDLHASVLVRDLAPEEADGVPETVTRVADAGCGVVVWGGSAEVAAAFRIALSRAGLRRVTLAGGDLLKQDAYASEAGGAGDRTIAVCGCADLSTSTGLAAQRFIQDFQSQFGAPPGPYAAEAWDAARMVLLAIRGGARDRGTVAAALRATPAYDGLAGRYAFGPGGELRSPTVRVFRDEGGRWIELAPA